MIDLPHRACHECGRRVLSAISRARYCGPCRNARREASRADGSDRNARRGVSVSIEAAFQAARAARLTEERATGKRRYTITRRLGPAPRPLDHRRRTARVRGAGMTDHRDLLLYLAEAQADAADAKARADQAEAETARLRAALVEAREWLRPNNRPGIPTRREMSAYDAVLVIDAALARTEGTR